jgi:hypothetical protein
MSLRISGWPENTQLYGQGCGIVVIQLNSVFDEEGMCH